MAEGMHHSLKYALFLMALFASDIATGGSRLCTWCNFRNLPNAKTAFRPSHNHRLGVNLERFLRVFVAYQS